MFHWSTLPVGYNFTVTLVTAFGCYANSKKYTIGKFLILNNDKLPQ